MVWRTYILISIIIALMSACETSKNSDPFAYNEKLESCEDSFLEDWWRKKATKLYPDYAERISAYDFEIFREGDEATITLTNPDFKFGGGPTAELDTENCRVTRVYLSQ